jgi:hypothetical protein
VYERGTGEFIISHLHMLSWLWYNSVSQKVLENFIRLTQKNEPPERCRSPGVHLCLAALVLTIEPLADIVAYYACYDDQ